jgi:hypothetical protein
MKRRTLPQPRSQYFLHVDLTVGNGQGPEFEKQIKAFIANGAFGQVNSEYATMRLVLALKDPNAGKYVHMWQIPNLSQLDIVELMQFCADTPSYINIDKLVTSEQQELVYREEFGLLAIPKGLPNLKTMRVSHQFTAQKLADYVGQMIPLFPDLAVANTPWYNACTALSVTGQLRTVTEFWQTQSPVASVTALLDAADTVGSLAQLHFSDKYREWFIPNTEVVSTYQSY